MILKDRQLPDMMFMKVNDPLQLYQRASKWMRQDAYRLFYFVLYRQSYINRIHVSKRYLNLMFAHEYKKRRSLVDAVLQFNPPRNSNPGNGCPAQVVTSNRKWCDMMFKRYFVAGSHFSRNTEVLDTCCGLGWGAFLVAHYAKTVDAFDMDEPSISIARCAWNKSNLTYYRDDALKMERTRKRYGVILAMETVEHFDEKGGETYIANCAKRTRKGGYLIGTTAFPRSADEIKTNLENDRHHLHLYTENELLFVLKKYYSQAVVQRPFFFARL